MKLIHYSNKFISDKAITHWQTQKQEKDLKPKGLWVSPLGEHDWKTWCQMEDFRLDMLTHATEVVLKPNANVLHLKSEEEVRAFDKKYESPLQIDDKILKLDMHYIDWPRVASEYDGILIVPYIWELRLARGFIWYNPWDCASGCLWNLRCVEKFIPIENAEILDDQGTGIVRHGDESGATCGGQSS